MTGGDMVTLPSAFLTAPGGSTAVAEKVLAGITTDPSVLIFVGIGGGGKPPAGGVGKVQPPEALAVAPVGGVQFAGGATPAGIEVPGTTTSPFGRTVIPTGAEPMVKVVPGGSVIPDGTETPVGRVTPVGMFTPGGKTVPEGIV
jgi:hypothetical protein